LNRLHDKKV